MAEQDLAHARAVQRQPAADLRDESHRLRCRQPLDHHSLLTFEDCQLNVLAQGDVEILHEGQGQRPQ
jgi:hypothetical protein